MMLVEETTVPQAALPVRELKDHLRLGSGFADDDLQDGLVESYLRAAIAAVEARTGKVLVARDFSWTLQRWRDDRRQPLPVAPVSAITGVTLVDSNGAETAADPAAWKLEPDDQRPHLVARYAALPSIGAQGSVRIGLLAGYGPEWGDMPADLGHAVIMLAGHYYEYRHDRTLGAPGLPIGVASLIERYRTVRLFMGGRT